IGNFRGDAQFYTWLHRIAVNTAKNHLVAMGRRPPGADIDVADAEQFASGIRLRDNDTPVREMMRRQMEQTVLRAAEGLPEVLRTAIYLRADDGPRHEELAQRRGCLVGALRAAINLREVEGLSYEEIAQRMGCPVGTVRSRIFRAREAIDQELKPLMEDETSAERATR